MTIFKVGSTKLTGHVVPTKPKKSRSARPRGKLVKRDKFYGLTPEQIRADKKLFALWMKANPTVAEKAMANILRKIDVKFESQLIVFGYIPDFCSHSAKIIIEVDGTSHEGREDYDLKRDTVFREHGYAVIRVQNADAIHRPAKVLAYLRSELKRLKIVAAVRAKQLRHSPNLMTKKRPPMVVWRSFETLDGEYTVSFRPHSKNWKGNKHIYQSQVNMWSKEMQSEEDPLDAELTQILSGI